MRLLLPPTDSPGAELELDDIAACYEDDRPSPAGRPYVLVNMVASLDGAISVSGRSGGLSNPADRAAFHAIRSIADVILVGSGTVLAETYHPPQASPEVQARRTARGQTPVPRLAIASASLRLPPDHPVFSDPDRRPIVLTVDDADAARRAALEPVADLVTAGAGSVDMPRALTELAAKGAAVVLCEGGPTLNASLAEAGAIDELCLTVAPVIAGGSAARAVAGADPVELAMELVVAIEDAGALLLRYRSQGGR